MVFWCQYCCFSSLEWKQLLRHTFEAHSNAPGFNFICSVNGCSQTFQTYSGITSHLRRKHRGQGYNDQPNAPLTEGDLFMDETEVSIGTDIQSEAPGTQQHDHEVDNLERAAALFLLCLKEHYHITQAAVDFAMSQVQQMVTFAIKDIECAVEKEIQSPSTESPPNLSSILQCF